MLDEATIERIVREVIRRLLEVNPSLFYEAGAGDRAFGADASRATPSGGSFGPPLAGNTFGAPSSGSVFGSSRPVGGLSGAAVAMPGAARRPGASAGLANCANHHGRVLTEYDLILVRKAGHRVLTIARRTIVTPLARDRARDMGIELRYRD